MKMMLFSALVGVLVLVLVNSSEARPGLPRTSYGRRPDGNYGMARRSRRSMKPEVCQVDINGETTFQQDCGLPDLFACEEVPERHPCGGRRQRPGQSSPSSPDSAIDEQEDSSPSSPDSAIDEQEDSSPSSPDSDIDEQEEKPKVTIGVCVPKSCSDELDVATCDCSIDYFGYSRCDVTADDRKYVAACKVQYTDSEEIVNVKQCPAPPGFVASCDTSVEGVSIYNDEMRAFFCVRRRDDVTSTTSSTTTMSPTTSASSTTTTASSTSSASSTTSASTTTTSPTTSTTQQIPIEP